MHDLRWIRDNPAAFDEGRRRRGLEPLSATIVAFDERRRAAIAASQVSQERRNAASKEIGAAMKAGDAARAEALKAEVAELKLQLPTLEAEEKGAVGALDAALAEVPNHPRDDVPEGRDETDNVLLRSWGDLPVLGFAPKEHFALGEALGLMDFEAATRMSGARFVVLKGGLARMERALAQMMLDLHVDHHGYTEVAPPILVRDEAMFGTAQLPKFEDDQFSAVSNFLPSVRKAEIETQKKEIDLLFENEAKFSSLTEEVEDLISHFTQENKTALMSVVASYHNKFLESLGTAFQNNHRSLKGWLETLENLSQRLWLIPTAEVPLTNLVREQILDEASLPLRFTAATPCFRAEAGAAGRDTRGMIRQHQFTKVELVSITAPEQSRAEHERMLGCAEAVLRKLELPYRVMTLCTGDMGFASQKTYDIEVWLPGQDRYREISSCSVCGDFQARRMNARFRGTGAKGTRFVHTLNGSGVAVGRCLVAVLENYQEADGSIRVPDALRGYMGGLERIMRV